MARQSKAIRRKNLEEAKSRIGELPDSLKQKTPYHWVIPSKFKGQIEFWPSTMKWCHNSKNSSGASVQSGSFDDFTKFVREMTE